MTIVQKTDGSPDFDGKKGKTGADSQAGKNNPGNRRGIGETPPDEAGTPSRNA